MVVCDIARRSVGISDIPCGEMCDVESVSVPFAPSVLMAARPFTGLIELTGSRREHFEPKGPEM